MWEISRNNKRQVTSKLSRETNIIKRILPASGNINSPTFTVPDVHRQAKHATVEICFTRKKHTLVLKLHYFLIFMFLNIKIKKLCNFIYATGDLWSISIKLFYGHTNIFNLSLKKNTLASK